MFLLPWSMGSRFLPRASRSKFRLVVVVVVVGDVVGEFFSDESERDTEKDRS